MWLCSGISTRFSLAELELGIELKFKLDLESVLELTLKLELFCEEFLLDKILTLELEDKDAD